MALSQQHPGTVLALAALGLLGALLALVWPVAAIGLAGAVLLCAVALRAPALGLVGDLLLAAVAIWLCFRAGRRPFVAVWRDATRGERIAWALVGAWLVASALQVL